MGAKKVWALIKMLKPKGRRYLNMGAKTIVGAKIVQELSKAYSVNNSTWRFEKSDVEPKSDVLPYRMPLSLSSFFQRASPRRNDMQRYSWSSKVVCEI